VTQDGGGASRSTDPAAGTSSATDVSLREYVEMRINAESRRLEQRIDASHEAVAKAEDAMTLRLEGMNEFRSQIQSERATYATREQRDDDQKRVGRIEGTISKLVGGLILASFLMPLLTGVIVYLLTRHAIPTSKP